MWLFHSHIAVTLHNKVFRLGFDATECSQNCNIIQEIVKKKKESNLDSLNGCDNVTQNIHCKYMLQFWLHSVASEPNLNPFKYIPSQISLIE